MMNRLPAHVSLPVFQGLLHQQFVFGAEKIWRTDDVVIACRSVHRLQVDIPLNMRSEFAQLNQAEFIINVLWIAALDVIHLRLSQRGLNCDDRIRIGSSLRLWFAGQDEHLLHVRAEFLQSLPRLVVGIDVVIAIRKTEAALIDLRDHLRGVVIILPAAKTEKWRVRLIVGTLPRAGKLMVKTRDLKRDV